ncbi:hypothetical protein [Streptomyces sp. TRM68367]|uniref:hypothetical protein n=1 Tax=Streptomyces sp. TRM68367 TaxID=2758415 RepID=UPI00165C2926|nr:hypothetical protein [Streptomyces sp. TRM68367]MBC9728039.1 hypothetical protein [Streptomyces sp. TRM68367]
MPAPIAASEATRSAASVRFRTAASVRPRTPASAAPRTAVTVRTPAVSSLAIGPFVHVVSPPVLLAAASRIRTDESPGPLTAPTAARRPRRPVRPSRYRRAQ